MSAKFQWLTSVFNDRLAIVIATKINTKPRQGLFVDLEKCRINKHGINIYMNKYSNWYGAIIENAKNRKNLGYIESHHIRPLSMGGNNTPDNMVDLTAREHFVCHWLLTKMTTGEDHYKMLNALRMMRAQNPNQLRYKTKITARVYANLKEEYSKLQSIKVSGSGNPMYNRPVSESVRLGRSIRATGDNNPAKMPGVGKKISESKFGKKRAAFSDEWRQNLSAAKQGENNNMFGKHHSIETKQKMREIALGRKQDPDTIKRKADAIRGTKREKMLCPHCAQLIAVNTFPRWHGDKCKKRINT